MLKVVGQSLQSSDDVLGGVFAGGRRCWQESLKNKIKHLLIFEGRTAQLVMGFHKEWQHTFQDCVNLDQGVICDGNKLAYIDIHCRWRDSVVISEVVLGVGQCALECLLLGVNLSILVSERGVR